VIKVCSGSSNEEVDKLVDYIETMDADKDNEDWHGKIKYEIRLPVFDLFMVTIEDASLYAVNDLLTLSLVCSINGKRDLLVTSTQIVAVHSLILS